MARMTEKHSNSRLESGNHSKRTKVVHHIAVSFWNGQIWFSAFLSSFLVLNSSFPSWHFLCVINLFFSIFMEMASYMTVNDDAYQIFLTTLLTCFKIDANDWLEKLDTSISWRHPTSPTFKPRENPNLSSIHGSGEPCQPCPALIKHLIKLKIIFCKNPRFLK